MNDDLPAAIESAPQANVATTNPAEIQQHGESIDYISAITRAASNPDVDVDKMQQLMDMQFRLMDRQAEEAFNRALSECQSEIPVVVKGSDNQQTRSKYANLEAVNRAVVPVYTRHGFSLSFGTEPSSQEGHIRITCDVSHRDGHSRRYDYDLPYDLTGIKGQQNKTAIHASGSTTSYGRRYLTNLIFNVSTTDDDDGQLAGNPQNGVGIQGDTIDAIVTAMENTGKNDEQCLSYINTRFAIQATRLTQLTEAQGQALLQRLNKQGGLR